MSSYRRKCATFLHVCANTYQCCKFCNWAQTGNPGVPDEEEGAHVFLYLMFEDGFRGGRRHRASKNIKAAKEGDKEKTEQADGGDRPG